MARPRVNCLNCGKTVEHRRLDEHTRSCNNQKSACKKCGRQYTRFRDHRCPDQKSECKNCGELYTRLKDHQCKSLLSYLSLKEYGWASKCPERFTYGLATLADIDDKTKSLWENRVPSLIQLISPHSDLDLWTAVFTSIVEKPTYKVFQGGEAPSLELSETRKIEIAATAMFQIRATEVQSPICSVLDVWLSSLSGISMEPPEQVKSSHHICESAFEVAVNVTPEGCFVDLHYDLGQEVLSKTFGKCEKVWLLFPPTEKNLKLYAESLGFDNKLSRIGSRLHGGIIVKTTSAYALDLPAGTLHAVFTTVGGFLGGITYSTSESLPMMGRLLIAQLPIFRHVSNAVLEDLRVYTKALSSSLDMDLPKLVSHALRSWVDLYPHLQGLLKSGDASTELIRHVSETQRTLKELSRKIPYALQCACGHYAENIGEHFATSHMLEERSGAGNKRKRV